MLPTLIKHTQILDLFVACYIYPHVNAKYDNLLESYSTIVLYSGEHKGLGMADQ